MSRFLPPSWGMASITDEHYASLYDGVTANGDGGQGTVRFHSACLHGGRRVVRYGLAWSSFVFFMCLVVISDSSRQCTNRFQRPLQRGTAV